MFHFLANKMQDCRKFVLHNCILIFDAEPVYLKPQVNNVNNKELPETQNPRKRLVFQKS